MRFLIILLTLCSLTLPTIASATDVTDIPVVQQDLAIATQYWGVTISPYAVEVRPLVLTGAVAESEQPGHSQRLSAETARALLPKTSEYRWACVIIVHEYGHSTGHGHVTDPNNVMYPAPSADSVPGCNAAFPSLEEEAHAEVRIEQAEIKNENRAAAKRHRSAAQKHHRHHHHAKRKR
jgi:hypothetical protein